MECQTFFITYLTQTIIIHNENLVFHYFSFIFFTDKKEFIEGIFSLSKIRIIFNIFIQQKKISIASQLLSDFDISGKCFDPKSYNNTFQV